MVRPFDGELIGITPVSVGNAFQLTPEHPVLCVPRQKVTLAQRSNRALSDVDETKLLTAKPEFVAAGDLQVGDFIHYPINQIEHDDPAFGTAALQVLGYYLAEGCVQLINGCEAVTFTFHIDESSYVEELSSAIHELTGKTPWTNRQPEKHAVVVGVYSKLLYAFCLEHAGKLASGKHLSKQVMDLPADKQRILLDAYYNGDGNVYERYRAVHPGHDNFPSARLPGPGAPGPTGRLRHDQRAGAVR